MVNLQKRKTQIISLVVLAIIAVLIPLTQKLVSRRTFLRQKAVEPQVLITPSINDFGFAYKDLLAMYGDSQKIQLFGGGTVMSEFIDGTGKIYAGHLGSFWAPPFYSDFGNDRSKWETGGFNFGLVFSDGSTCFTESPTDLNSEFAYWYPSKSVVKKSYEKVEVTGVRVPLPGRRGFGLKLTLKNKTTTTQNFKVLFLGNLPTFDTLKKGYSTNSSDLHYFGPWVWLMRRSSVAKNSDSGYLSANSTVLIRNLITDNLKTGDKDAGFFAAGLNNSLLSWELSDNKSNIYNSFRENCQIGQLKNVDNDSASAGSSFGLVGDYTQLGPTGSGSDSKVLSLIIGLGESEQEAIRVINDFKNKDIETETDSWWNNRLQRVFSSLPQLNTGNASLNKLFKNSVLTYLVNRWETYGIVGESAGFGQAVGFFPWLTGTAGFFPLADSVQWKSQLIKLMGSDNDKLFRNCRAYDNVAQNHFCDTFYAYDRVSMIDAVYKYITATRDTSFLNENINGVSVFDHLLRYAEIDGQRFPANDLLKDFGNDWNLYEYTRHAAGCDLGGRYTGQVVSPNFERVVAYRRLADLAGKRGDLQRKSQLIQEAENLKSRINSSLWDSNNKWFKTINWWPACGSANSCSRNNSSTTTTFYNIAPYFLLQYDDLLSSGQKEGLLSRFNNFIGPYGLYSLDKNYKGSGGWCSGEEDWHGPGLYSGAIGAVLTGLFKNGQKNIAYDILQKYQYLEKVPYFSQSLSAEGPPFFRQSTAYLEGVSFAQSLIEGMFGIQPKLELLRIQPNIPANLLSSGPVSLNNIKIQGQIYNVSVSQDGVHNLEMIINPQAGTNYTKEKFAFEFGVNGKMNLTVKGLFPRKNYSLTIKCLPSGQQCQSLSGMTDSNGVLNLPIDLTGLSYFEGNIVVSTPTPTATRTPTPSLTKTPTPTTTLGPSMTPSLTQTPTRTLTPTKTNTPSPTRTLTPTGTVVPSATKTPTPTPSRTPSPTPTRTNTPTATRTPVLSPTSTPVLICTLDTCYGSCENCRRNCDHDCTFLTGENAIRICGAGWSQGYQCCNFGQAPCNVTPTPTATRTPTTTSTPTATPSLTLTLTLTPTPIPCSCPAGVPPKSKGNANCDGMIDLRDFQLWRNERWGRTTTKNADFNCDSIVDIRDFQLWLNGKWGR